MTDQEIKIPEKFLDKETGQLNAKNLLKSYKDLEKKLSTSNQEEINLDLPQDPSEYELDFQDEAIGKKLFENKFTKSQAKCVHDILNQNLNTKIQETEFDLKQQTQLQNLKNYFGGQENWEKVASQIQTYADNNLSQDLYEVLASSYDGVLLLYKMLNSSEPKILDETSSPSKQLTLDSLKKLMNNPKYWKENDPEFCQKVKEGFEKLYK